MFGTYSTLRAAGAQTDDSRQVRPLAWRWESVGEEVGAAEAGAVVAPRRFGWLRWVRTVLIDPDQMIATELLRGMLDRH